MSVPSEVVEYLDASYPQAKDDKPFYLGIDDAPAAAYILRLLDAMPPGIVTLKGQALAEYGEAVESLRMAVDAWRAGNRNSILDWLRRRGMANPLAFLRKHLASLPDSVVSPTTTDLAFITDPQLRDALRLDIAAANRSFGVSDWKGCTVISGSVVEALLLWAVNEHEGRGPGRVAAAASALITTGRFNKLPPKDWNFWDLFHLIEVALEMGIIKENTASQCRIAKNFRNLIHPGRAVRLAQTCNRGTALSALASIEHVDYDLS
jgi:hypothetical protein